MLRDLDINEHLKQKGYTNKLISYQEFLELYEPYKNEMSELEFSKILGISYSNYFTIKGRGTKARILKEEKVISEERKEEIRNALKEKGYANRLVSYQEFLELYEPYKNEMTEVEFANIIGMLYPNYKNIKSRGTRTRILKEKKVITEARKEEIRNTLIEKGYAKRSISYQEFLELYEPYKNEMSDTEFRKIIGISDPSYMSIKNRGTKARILKEEVISKEKKEEIRENLRKKGYTNKLISYQEFLELYEPYKNEMTEVKFAEIIDISYINYMSMKNSGERTRMLKEEKVIPKEIMEEIRENLRKKRYTNKLISYQEFLELYEPYKNEMSEIEFAEIIGIVYANHNNMKNKGTRTRILKEEKVITEARQEEIREDLRKKGYENKLIGYQEFLELYEPYKNEMTDIEFIEIIGISYTNYMNVKNDGARASIKLNYKKLTRLIYKLRLDSREYKREELEKLCKEYGVTLYELLSQIFPSTIVERFMNKEFIYIGITPIPESFLEKYSEELLCTAQELSKSISKKYKLKRYIEDIASEALLDAIRKRGDTVKNSETEEEALEFIRNYMSRVIKYKYISKCKVRGTVSLDAKIGKERNRTRYDVIKTLQNTETEEVVIQERESEETKEAEKSEKNIVEDMKTCYENGMKNTEAIEYVRKKYGISRKELLKILEQELSRKRRIVKTATGEVYLGEEYDD